MSKKGNTENFRKSRGRIRDDAMFPVPISKDELPADYFGVLAGIKERIQSER